MTSKTRNVSPTKKTIETLIGNITSGKDILYLFSSYIASNPDFKYNTTYLTDKIDSFLTGHSDYQEKYEHFDIVIDEISRLINGKYIIKVTFDKAFQFRLNKTITSKKIDAEKGFRFDQIGSKETNMILTHDLANSNKKIEYHYYYKDFNEITLEEVNSIVTSFSKIIESNNHE